MIYPLAWDDDDPGVDVYRSGPWRPSREAFARYLAREVELARSNLRRPGVFAASDTLHSFATVCAARAPLGVAP